jgi:hypothetical protein
VNHKATGWAAAAAAAIAGLGGFAVQEDNNDLALEAIRGHVQARAACEVSLAKELLAHHHGEDSP